MAFFFSSSEWWDEEVAEDLAAASATLVEETLPGGTKRVPVASTIVATRSFVA